MAPGKAQLVPALLVHSRGILVAFSVATHGGPWGVGVHVVPGVGVGDGGGDELHWPMSPNWQLGDGDGELPPHG